MTAIETAQTTHEQHCYEFRSDTRKEIVGIRSTLARWSVVMGLVTIAANAAAAAVVVRYIGMLLR